ncbi:MAG: formamidopyrimidine-DNA glycosylase, partial [Chloroflexota bacterium]|nr:formamidopyrimidine-DNA glycosylase [Chloroflexota bacterium]
LERIFMGHAHFYGPDDAAARRAGFGPDPLSANFSPEYLAAAFARKPKQPVKAILMDQSQVAGIGNAYSDEILVRAKIYPLRPAGSLTSDEILRVVNAAREVLERSVSMGGDNDYTDLFGAPGCFSTTVHSQAVCQDCGGVVRQVKGGGRTTYYCESCQPIP